MGNILGVGPGELIVVFVIMLVVAGPKRMIQWAYHIGRYTAHLRAMVQETMNAIQKEIAASGLDVPKELTSLQNTTFDVMKEVSKIVDPGLTPPAAEPPDPAEPAASAPAVPAQPAAPPSEPKPDGAIDTKNDDQTRRYETWTPS